VLSVLFLVNVNKLLLVTVYSQNSTWLVHKRFKAFYTYVRGINTVMVSLQLYD